MQFAFNFWHFKTIDCCCVYREKIRMNGILIGDYYIDYEFLASRYVNVNFNGKFGASKRETRSEY